MTAEKALAINYEFKLELDRQMTIGSFETKHGLPPRPTQPVVPMGRAAVPVSSEDAQIKANLAKLSPEDRRLAEQQVMCAIDQDSALGSMGVPFKEMIKGRPVFLCCKGCVKEAKANPDHALQMLDQLTAKLKGGKR
jgi:hypothetical protein